LAPGSGSSEDDIPVVGETYLEEYADMPWISLSKNQPRSNTKNRRLDAGKAMNNSLARRKGEAVEDNQSGNRRQDGGKAMNRRPNSYGEFQLQELPPPDDMKKRKEIDSIKIGPYRM